MNTPSKEALDAAENVQDYLGFPRRATMDLAAIIDRHFEQLRQRSEQAEARVKELQKQEAESRRLFYAEQDKRQSAEFRCEELAEALRPFAEFANKWDKNPIRGLDDALYSIHNEASLRLSDCKTARAAIDAARKEVQP